MCVVRFAARFVVRFAACFVICAAVLASAPALAQTGRPAELKFFIGMGLTGGGSEVVVVNYSNGNSYTLRGGGLVQFVAGAQYAFSERLSGSLGLGYHFDSINAVNGKVTLARVPIELLAHYYVTDRIRLGGGLRYISNTKLSGSGFGSGISGSYKSSLGAVLEGEYMFNPRFGLKARLVSEKYNESNGPGSIKGDHIGLFGSFYF